MGRTSFLHRAPKLALAAIVVVTVSVPLALRPLSVRAAGCGAWMDPSKSATERAHALLDQLTADGSTGQSEKLALTQITAGLANGAVSWDHYGVAGYIPGDPTYCIPDLVLNDAGQGVGDMQIPTNVVAFPAPIAQAASWDPGAQQAFGAELGSEAHTKGVDVQLTPAIEVDRLPLNGRNWEYVSEDPYLAGQTATAVTRGLQSQNVIATLKHHIVNSQEAIRSGGSSDLDERTLHEIYEQPYAAAIQQGGAGAIMCSYNRIGGDEGGGAGDTGGGIYSCQNPATLNTDLKQQMGFPGFVMSDWGATHSTVASALGGLDMEMGSHTYFGSTLGAAIAAGQVPQSRLDDMVYRILYEMFAVGLFDNPPAAYPQAYATDVDTPGGSGNAVATQVEEQGAVLLKDDGGVLPLQSSPAAPRRIALIGTDAGPAGATLNYNGGGSGHIPEAGSKPDVVSALQGMQQYAATNANGAVITYADGNGPGFADAVAAASAADVAVVFAYDVKTEGTDQTTLSLPPDGSECQLVGCSYPSAGYDQDKLISAVAAANPNTVVVLETGQPVTMPWLGQVKGVLEAWYPGQDGGNAIADLLFGRVDPSGHLPETFPASMDQMPQSILASQYKTQPNADCASIGAAPPCSSPHSVYAEGLNVGYRWYDDMGLTPLFPFGYGLSYTTFRYSNYRLTGASSPGGDATVGFDVTNTGRVAGQEVAQVYVGSPANNYVDEPLHQLRAYQKTALLQPGQTQHVILTLDPHSVSYWDTASHSWRPENGCHPVWVGSSSRDIALQGSGLDGAMQLVSDCAASVSTYVMTAAPSVPESPSNVLMLLVPAALAVTTGAALRRRRRSAPPSAAAAG